jgi:hypothetical protein
VAILFKPFDFFAPNHFLFSFIIFQFGAHLMKVIMSAPDEGYYERT